MKKSLSFFTVLVTAVLLWACTNEEGLLDAGLQVNAGVRSIDEAVQIAKYDNPIWTEHNFNFTEDIVYFTVSTL